MLMLSRIISKKLVLDPLFAVALLAFCYLPLFFGYLGGKVAGSWITLIGLILVSYVYSRQVKYIKKVFPEKRLKRQFGLIAFSVLLPQLAVMIGDIHGTLAYGDVGLEIGFYAYFIVTPFLLAFIMSFFVLANAIFVKTGGQNSVAKMTGKILSISLVVLISAISLFLYNFFYSLHDPSTE